METLMPAQNRKADYLNRALEARRKAAASTNCFVMDAYLDVAAEWKALAEQAEELQTLHRAAPLSFPASVLNERPVTTPTWSIPRASQMVKHNQIRITPSHRGRPVRRVST